MYKKIFKVLIIIFTIFLINNKTTFANTEYIKASSNQKEKELVLTVSISKDYSINGFLGTINYDEEKLKLNKCTSTNFTLYQEDNRVLLESIKKQTDTNLLTCNFTVVKEIETNTFTITDISLSDGTSLLRQDNLTIENTLETKEDEEQPEEKEEVKTEEDNEEIEEKKEEKKDTKKKSNTGIIITVIIIILLIILLVVGIILYKKKKKVVIPTLLLLLILISKSSITNAEIVVDEEKLTEIREILLGIRTDENLYDYDDDKQTTINDLILGLVELNKPIITFKNVKTTGTKEYKTSLINKVEIKSNSKIDSVYYCITTKDSCTPNINYKYDGSSTIEFKYPDNKDAQKLCIKVNNSLGLEKTICDENQYKVDSQSPKVSLISKKVTIGEEETYNTKNNLTIEYGPSGGSYTCSNDYKIGTNTITCIVNSKNGLNTKINYELVVVETYDIVHFVDSLNPNYKTKFVSNDLTILESNGKFAIIDFGYKENEIDSDKVLDYIESLNIKEFEFALLTHGHSDHIGFFDDIAEKYPIKNIYLKEKVKDYPNAAYYGGYEKVLNTIEKHDIPIRDVEKVENQKIIFGDMIIDLYNTDFLLNENDPSTTDNANSIVAVATVHGKRIYFASDIGEYGSFREELNVEISTAKEIGKVDVYKVAHHGYMTYQNSLTALQYLEPTYSVVNNDENSSQLDGLIDRIKFGNGNYKETYFTSNGHITMTFNPIGTISIKQGLN